MLKTTDFDFDLPNELIASEPLNPRDSSKMLIWKNQKIIDKQTKDLADFLEKDDVIVLNDTKVIKAKLSGFRDKVKIEINLHKKINGKIWQVFARPAKRLKIGDKFIINDNFHAQILDKKEGIVNLEFNLGGNDFFTALEKYGQTPLPPYIKKKVDNNDTKNYQTIYAKNSGAVAAPTAGLHFTEELFNKLEKKGVKKTFTTLNVGAGTFLPVKSDLVKDHQMHSEYFSISKESCDVINEAKKNGKRIIAIGTTSLRVLESVADDNGILEPQARETNIFIYPPYRFKIVDILMTNFHLPKSTLFMLISAFIGTHNAHKIYEHATHNKYRFYSFGDANLLFNK